MPAMPIERTVRYRSLDRTFFANVVEDPNAFLGTANSRLLDAVTHRVRPFDERTRSKPAGPPRLDVPPGPR
jgi:hypothetical protein